MRKKSFIIVSVFCLFVIASVVVNKFATAQSEGQSIEVSPPSQEITVDPGKTTVIKTKLRNRSNNTLPVKVRIEDFTAKGNEGQVELSSNSPYSVVSWTKVTPNSFNLEAGQEQEVTATITIPSNAAGGRFGSFVFGVQPETANSNAATVSQEIASLFLIKVTGPVDEKLTIKSFKAPDYAEFGPVPLEINFANSGNVHIKAYGLINVTDMFGKKVADIVVPGVNIFPDAERLVKASLDKQFLFGPYTATALMYYGSNETQSLNATTTFFVFPIKIAAGAIIILFLLFLMRKRFKKAGKALFGK